MSPRAHQTARPPPKLTLESAWSHFGYIPKSTADLGCGLSLEDSRNGITQLSPKAVLLGPEDD
jgi:hypothetical protein